MAELEYASFVDETTNPKSARHGLRAFSVLMLAGIVIAAAVVGLALVRQKEGRPTSGPAPEFALHTFEGDVLHLEDLRGKIVVVNFWASWCAPCRIEAPEVEAAWRDYQDQDVVFLGIAYTDTDRNARAYLEEYDITYPNGLDLGTRISEDFHITGVPETYIIDRNGDIVRYYFSRVTRANLVAVLDELSA